MPCKVGPDRYVPEPTPTGDAAMGCRQQEAAGPHAAAVADLPVSQADRAPARPSQTLHGAVSHSS